VLASPLHQTRIGPFFNSENHMEMCLLVLCIKQELVLLLGLSFFKWAMFCTVLRCPLHQARIGPFLNSENHMEMCLLVLCIKQELVLLLGLSFYKWAMFCTVLRCPLHQARIGPFFKTMKTTWKMSLLVLFQVGNVLYSS
jgi:hypothetical protein